MGALTDFVLHAGLIGIGATAFMDVWALAQKRLLGIPSLDYAMVGRWIGHIPRGRFAHNSISSASSIEGERVIGWVAHYVIGIVFAAVLLLIWGLDWADNPTLLPALFVGLSTVLFPLFVMQPAFGAGIAASRTPKPSISRLRSVIAHFSFGLGLYLAAESWLALNFTI